jgi:hypothetical protein
MLVVEKNFDPNWLLVMEKLTTKKLTMKNVVVEICGDQKCGDQKVATKNMVIESWPSKLWRSKCATIQICGRWILVATEFICKTMRRPKFCIIEFKEQLFSHYDNGQLDLHKITTYK